MVGFSFCHFAGCYRPTVEKQICYTCPELKTQQIICIHSAKSASVCYEPHHIVCLSVYLWDLYKHFKNTFEDMKPVSLWAGIPLHKGKCAKSATVL